MKTSSIKREQMTDPTTGTRPFTPYIESRKTITIFQSKITTYRIPDGKV